MVSRLDAMGIVGEIAKAADVGHDGKLSLIELSASLADREPICDFYTWLCGGSRKRFMEHDHDNDGRIDTRELHSAVARYLGAPMPSQEDLEDMYPVLSTPQFQTKRTVDEKGRPLTPPPR